MNDEDKAVSTGVDPGSLWGLETPPRNVSGKFKFSIITILFWLKNFFKCAQ